MAAFKLTKAEATEKDKRAERLRELATKVKEVLEAENEVIQTACSNINDALREYNSEAIDAQEWVEAVAANWQGAFDDKSEAWQSGDKGVAVQNLIEQWGTFAPTELDDVEVDEFDLTPSDADDLDTLASEPEE